MSDKSQTPTGVFVRLPLSEKARELLVGAAAFGQPDDSHDKAILSIGTPVTGDALDIIGYADNREIGAFSPSADVNPCAVIFAEEITSHNIPLVRQSDHQAALAAAQAEIARKDIELDWLRDRMEVVRSYLTEAPAFVAKRGALDAIEEALKGPEA